MSGVKAFLDTNLYSEDMADGQIIDGGFTIKKIFDKLSRPLQILENERYEDAFENGFVSKVLG
jgi:hypothetical protein